MSTTPLKIREKGIKALGTILKQPQNIKTIEKWINQTSLKNNPDDPDLWEKEYSRNVYQVIGDLLSNKPLKDILGDIKTSNIGWKHPFFKNISDRILEHDEFIVNPFEVIEGITECGKCHSKRTYTYQKQVRSCDESSTTFAQCMNCNTRWTYSG